MPLRISDREWDRLYPRTQVAINPTLKEVTAAVIKVQKRCRKNVLTPQRIEQCFNTVISGQETSECIGLMECPHWFDFQIETTILQVIKLAEGVIGIVATRQTVEPGDKAKPPVQQAFTKNPTGWHHDVTTWFWAHLDEATQRLLRERMLLEVLERAAVARWSETGRYSAARAGQRRHLQLQTLFATADTVYISELTEALKDVADSLATESRESIAWSEFQKRWPSISARYRRELLGLQRSGRISRDQLIEYRDTTGKYALTFDFWNGPQRVFPTEQLVFQVTAPSLIAEWKSSADTRDLLEMLQMISKNSQHPVTPETVGWLRVHVDDERRFGFVDEIQSDWFEILLEEEDEPESAAAGAMAKAIADWPAHGFAAVKRWCQQIGYGVAIHSRDTAALVPGYTPSERKRQIYYESVIKRFRLEPAHHREYNGIIYTLPRCKT